VKAKGIQHPISGWEKKKDHPVYYVDWKDAMAYCQWLNNLLKGELPSGLILRLPTEAEWEKAARWNPSPSGRGQGKGEAREWPWGNEFDKNKCNSSEGGKGGTTPVGSYSPRGDSPFGCADMVGNVWEWTHSLFKPYPYQVEDGREDEKASGRRVVRGGAFYNNEGDARCAYRYDSLDDDRGFRVAASPVLS
jgi:formylglycine-generating enzyme required for sulfatase activity